MSNGFKEIIIKNLPYYFFDQLINMKNLDPYKNKKKNSYKNNLIIFLRYIIVDNVNLL